MLSPAIVILALISAVLAVTMLFAKNAVTSALCLLGVLIMSAGIYGLMGEHMVATIQLVVYAGAIMVLFIFSIMLLNLNKEETEYKKKPLVFFGVIGVGCLIAGVLCSALFSHFSVHHQTRALGPYTHEVISNLGGNSKVLSFALFSQHYIAFEVISLALLTAIVGAVVLAKRKFD
jgi:NADH-quinone oxidoreductase subunit J